MSTVPIPGTSWVRILPGYRCIHTPGVSVFAKKKISWYGLGRVRYGLGRDGTKTKPDGIIFHLISSPLLLDSLSSLSGKATRFSLSLPHFTVDGQRKVLQLWTCGDESYSDYNLTVYFFYFAFEYENMGQTKPQSKYLFLFCNAFDIGNRHGKR
jgi:hypothetical protein